MSIPSSVIAAPFKSSKRHVLQSRQQQEQQTHNRQLYSAYDAILSSDSQLPMFLSGHQRPKRQKSPSVSRHGKSPTAKTQEQQQQQQQQLLPSLLQSAREVAEGVQGFLQHNMRDHQTMVESNKPKQGIGNKMAESSAGAPEEGPTIDTTAYLVPSGSEPGSQHFASASVVDDTEICSSHLVDVSASVGVGVGEGVAVFKNEKMADAVNGDDTEVPISTESSIIQPVERSSIVYVNDQGYEHEVDDEGDFITLAPIYSPDHHGKQRVGHHPHYPSHQKPHHHDDDDGIITWLLHHSPFSTNPVDVDPSVGTPYLHSHHYPQESVYGRRRDISPLALLNYWTCGRFGAPFKDSSAWPGSTVASYASLPRASSSSSPSSSSSSSSSVFASRRGSVIHEEKYGHLECSDQAEKEKKDTGSDGRAYQT
ncbi:hypothetical protein EDD11_008539 [Mortierella claussenii]|nr:hypothetical protein EDD11_008539 [Mortierella claussenii]